MMFIGFLEFLEPTSKVPRRDGRFDIEDDQVRCVKGQLVVCDIGGKGCFNIGITRSEEFIKVDIVARPVRLSTDAPCMISVAHCTDCELGLRVQAL